MERQLAHSHSPGKPHNKRRAHEQQHNASRLLLALAWHGMPCHPGVAALNEQQQQHTAKQAQP